jgi:hypothetical protein
MKTSDDSNPRIAGRLSESDYAAGRQVRERTSATAQNDADQGAALADELIEDVWNKRAPKYSTVVVRRKSKNRNANFPRSEPLRYAPMVQAVPHTDDEGEDGITRGDRQRAQVSEAHIRACLDRAKGQPKGIARDTLRYLYEDCDSPIDLKEIVDHDYPTLLGALKYVIAFDVHDQGRDKQLPEIPAREFTKAERDILESHEPLLVSFAAKYSRGYKSFNHARFADLMDTGLQEMVRRIPEWDRKMTIGAFLKPYIIGAMQERKRTRPPTTAKTHDDIPQLVKENIERWKIGHGFDHLDGVAQSRARVKATKRKAVAKAKKPAPIVPTARGNALGKLTDQQMKVYNNMRAKIPFSNIEMGKRLGVGEGRIRRIKKDVERILKQSM